MVQKLATPVRDRRLPILGCHQLIGVSKIYQDMGWVEPSIEQRQTTSRRLADRKVERFEKNITKRGAVPETTAKKGNQYPVGPILLGFFVFVVIGSYNKDSNQRGEIKATSVPSNYNKSPMETVFFGGGTPSLVPPRLVSLVLETLDAEFGVCSDAEISIEMDPGTFDVEKLKDLMNLGVNRVSLGVQAFQEELLKSCGRAHGVREIHEAIDIVGSCGVEN
ncbi:hypothetical protein T459_10075 [Capsicum annuum]|uniref:Radical SAM core domain-containing protein n=1 Tax=Capsicum annuum TaxID=4072 RepID=A0A2G3A154_CAPAN|nr:hypothetical protein T459_10075 [Capsicum annuum]